MTRQLLNLRKVPYDETDEVRELLRDNGIEFHETLPKPLGISMGDNWIREAADYRRARALMDEYQSERAHRARNDYLEKKHRGQADTLLRVARRRPVLVAFYMALARAFWSC